MSRDEYINFLINYLQLSDDLVVERIGMYDQQQKNAYIENLSVCEGFGFDGVKR